MFQEFRMRYPQAALISELVQIDHGKYIVRVAIENEGKTIATALSAADTVETAEDCARDRALALLTLPSEPQIPLLDNRDENNPQPAEVSPQAPVTPQKASKASKVTEILLPEPPRIPEIPVPEPELPKVAKMPEIPVPEPLFLDREEDSYSLSEELSPEAILPVAEEPEPSPPVVLPIEEIDYSVLKTKIDVEMKRLAWTTEKGREYLISTYGKKSRLLLTNEELLEFYHYLSSI
jgi:hypothetical protein